MFEIGNSLREARLRRGIEFVQAEGATKIRGKYLRALEEEQFSLLPSPTYVKGFLRTYAEYLGLDGQLYVDEYNSRFVVGEDDLRLGPRRSTVRPQRRNRRIETNVVLVALAAIAIVTIVVISAWKSAGGNGGAQTVARRPATPAVPRAVPPLFWVRAIRGDATVAAHDTNASGKLRFEGTVSAGEPALQLRGKRLWVSIDAPENVRIRVRGKLVHLRGRRPRVIIVTSTGIRPVS
jgi:hypothetical protein